MGNCLKRLLKVSKCWKAEHRGRRKDSHLPAVLHRLEGRAHGDFGLAVADVADQQPIHRHRRLHIALDVGNGRNLVFGFVVVEGVFKLVLEVVVRRKGMPFRGLALRVELEQLVGHVPHGLAHPGLGLGPLLGPQTVEHRRGPGIGRAILLDEVQTGKGNVEARRAPRTRAP